jgi:hypothetical protein
MEGAALKCSGFGKAIVGKYVVEKYPDGIDTSNRLLM